MIKYQALYNNGIKPLEHLSTKRGERLFTDVKETITRMSRFKLNERLRHVNVRATFL